MRPARLQTCCWRSISPLRAAPPQQARAATRRYAARPQQAANDPWTQRRRCKRNSRRPTRPQHRSTREAVVERAFLFPPGQGVIMTPSRLDFVNRGCGLQVPIDARPQPPRCRRGVAIANPCRNGGHVHRQGGLPREPGQATGGRGASHSCWGDAFVTAWPCLISGGCHSGCGCLRLRLRLPRHRKQPALQAVVYRPGPDCHGRGTGLRRGQSHPGVGVRSPAPPAGYGHSGGWSLLPGLRCQPGALCAGPAPSGSGPHRGLFLAGPVVGAALAVPMLGDRAFILATSHACSGVPLVLQAGGLRFRRGKNRTLARSKPGGARPTPAMRSATA